MEQVAEITARLSRSVRRFNVGRAFPKQVGFGLLVGLLVVFTIIHFNKPTDYSGYQQVTYQNPNSKPLKKAIFPVVQMPVPRLDSRRVFFGHEDILNFEKIIKLFLKEHPTWKTKNWCSLRRQRLIHGLGLSREVLDGIIKFLEYSYQSPSLFNLGEIEHQLSILKQRNFPTEPRPMSCNNCFPYNFNHIITPSKLCVPDTEVVMVVTTIPKNIAERKIVRRTWGSQSMQEKFHFKVIFLFGSGWPEEQVATLREESQNHNDILMDDFVDNYYNLTQKVLMGYKWILKECPQTKFVLRTADDATVNLPPLFSLIHRYGREETFQKYQVGHCFPHFEPHRAADAKGYLSTLEYDKEFFPPYALGVNFLTSINLTKELVEISPHVPFIAIEDAYFGLALARLGRGCHHIKGMRDYFSTHKEEVLMPRESWWMDLF